MANLAADGFSKRVIQKARLASFSLGEEDDGLEEWRIVDVRNGCNFSGQSN
jgi:hypothetical protein